jgi:hypothetical protein
MLIVVHRYKRSLLGLLTTTSLAIPTACTKSPAAPSGLPRPRGDEVVVLAGNGAADNPRGGISPKKTPLWSPNAMTVLPDGSLLVSVKTSDSPQDLVLVPKSGQTEVFPAGLHSATRAIAVRGRDVWTLWRGSTDVFQQSLDYGKPKPLTGGLDSHGRPILTEVDENGKPLLASHQRALAQSWDAEGLVTLPQGPPIIAMTTGRLYRMLGNARVQAFEPPNYIAALEAAGGNEFQAKVAASDNVGGFFIVGTTGAIHVSTSQPSHGFRFRTAITSTPDWISWGGATLSNGNIVVTSQGALYLISTHNGEVTKISTGAQATCKPTGTLSQFKIPNIADIARLSDDTIALSSRECNRVYGFHLPGS